MRRLRLSPLATAHSRTAWATVRSSVEYSESARSASSAYGGSRKTPVMPSLTVGEGPHTRDQSPQHTRTRRIRSASSHMYCVRALRRFLALIPAPGRLRNGIWREGVPEVGSLIHAPPVPASPRWGSCRFTPLPASPRLGSCTAHHPEPIQIHCPHTHHPAIFAS